MKVHFIAVGGSVMHNLAIALQRKGYEVSGSDDEIFEPALSRLREHGILPAQEGWFPEKIGSDIEAVILGMHARQDNPELQKAQELGLKIYSFPEYIYEQSRNKERVVIGGSHGKTTTTAMIMHVLRYHNREFDYVIGAPVYGFESTVHLSEAPVIIIEGDEYLTSPTDRRPKFLHYRHHIGLITGIAWDHMNVYPDFDDYVKQFENFAAMTPKAGALIYCEEDKLTADVCRTERLRSDADVQKYRTHPHRFDNGRAYLIAEDKEIPVPFFGRHNMQNLSGAKAVLHKMSITDKMFYEAIASFGGAAKRLEKIGESANSLIFKDFAHAPSKVRASVLAVKELHADRKLVACAELHTFSSLNKDFLGNYEGALSPADIAVVFYNPKAVALKRLDPISEENIREAFQTPGLKIFTEAAGLKDFLLAQNWKNTNLLMMSSGTFGHIDYQELTEKITSA